MFPECKVDCLVRKGCEGLLTNNPSVDEVLVWDKKRHKYRNLLQLWWEIRRRGYDAVVNLQRFGATGFITALSGAKEKIGFRKSPFSFGFTRAYPHHMRITSNQPHEVDRNLQLLKGWGTIARKRPAIYPESTHLEAVKPYKKQPYICIAPASVWFTKQFPPERWAALLNHQGVESYTVYLIGSPADDHVCSSILEKTSHRHVFNVAGQWDLVTTAALMKDATMNYVNDSAPLHMASAMNASVAAVFCSTIPEYGFGPLSEKSHVIQYSESLYCRPCTNHGKSHCPEGHFRCANAIDLKQFLEVLP